MKTPAVKGKRTSVFFAILTAICFSTCFILVPLGGFIIWIFSGACVFFLFMAIYSLIPPPKPRYTKTRFDPKEEELKAHIAFHAPIMISMFLGAILLVVIILFFAT
jgi:membrane protein YdbS with pleckstrin-like domain